MPEDAFSALGHLFPPRLRVHVFFQRIFFPTIKRTRMCQRKPLPGRCTARTACTYTQYGQSPEKSKIKRAVSPHPRKKFSNPSVDHKDPYTRKFSECPAGQLTCCSAIRCFPELPRTDAHSRTQHNPSNRDSARTRRKKKRYSRACGVSPSTPPLMKKVQTNYYLSLDTHARARMPE